MARYKQDEIQRMRRTDVAPTTQGLSKIDNLFREVSVGLGYDPAYELVQLAAKKDTPDALKAKIAFGFMEYFYPKMKAIQVNPDQGEVININVTYPDEKKAQAFETNLALLPSFEDLSLELQGEDSDGNQL